MIVGQSSSFAGMRSQQSARDRSNGSEKTDELLAANSKSHLVVALLEGLLSQARPGLFSVDGFGHLERHIEVAAFDGKIESRGLVLDEM